MTDRWQDLRRLFDAAKDLDPQAAEVLLASECGGDVELLAELRGLIVSHRRANTFLAGPPIGSTFEAAVTVEIPHDKAAGLLLKERYRIERELAAGGFGKVYLARDEQLYGKEVVVKLINEAAADPAWIEKHFRQEIEALARLNHSGVVGVFDTGRTGDGTPFLVLQYIPGETLRSVLEAGPMEVRRVARLARQLGLALEAAHQKAIFHRDLKPGNIILRDPGTPDEQAVIIDFGIASVKHEDSTGPEVTQVVGTFNYMAPEQHRGQPVAASDVFALSLIFAEMLTGKRATFNPGVPLDKSVPAQLRDSRPELPEAFADRLRTALAADPKVRPGAREFGESIAALLEESPAPSRRWIIGIVPVAALAAGAVYLLDNRGEVKPPPVVHEISFSVVRQRAERGAKPDRVVPSTIFSNSDRLRLEFRSKHGGHLYVLGGGKDEAGRPEYTTVFPSAKRAGAWIEPRNNAQVPESDSDWITFDPRPGSETMWIVWAESPIAELHALMKYANPEKGGLVTELADSAQVTGFLDRIRPTDFASAPGYGGWVTLQRAGPALIAKLALEHR